MPWPFGMSDYVQSVVVQGKVYVGGGEAGFMSDDLEIVMEYEISSGKWTKLSPYELHYLLRNDCGQQPSGVSGWMGFVWPQQGARYMESREY